MTRAAAADPAAYPGREAILDAALDLAERVGWDAVHLHEVAAALGIALADIRRHFDQKDALTEAWFDRADAAMLRAAEAPHWRRKPARQRLHDALCAWLDALTPHRRLTRQMLLYKLQPEHVHLQALGVARVSRTVQWWREAAGLESVGCRREAEELCLTAICLSVFARWLVDDSPDSAPARKWLDRALALAERTALRLDRPPLTTWTS